MIMQMPGTLLVMRHVVLLPYDECVRRFTYLSSGESPVQRRHIMQTSLLSALDLVGHQQFGSGTSFEQSRKKQLFMKHRPESGLFTQNDQPSRWRLGTPEPNHLPIVKVVACRQAQELKSDSRAHGRKRGKVKVKKANQIYDAWNPGRRTKSRAAI